jgi:hypothetical protein
MENIRVPKKGERVGAQGRKGAFIVSRISTKRKTANGLFSEGRFSPSGRFSRRFSSLVGYVMKPVALKGFDCSRDRRILKAGELAASGNEEATFARPERESYHRRLCCAAMAGCRRLSGSDSALPFGSEAVVHSISGITPSHRRAFFNSAICPAWYTACCVVLWKSR